jgi:eukaryotic-like serine/threonine-protein kinase
MTGKQIGQFRIESKLGSGGMGVVYEAHDSARNLKVAIKFLSQEMTKDPEAMERFRREARAASLLAHPNICPVLETGEHESLPYIVMPLLEGQTLRQISPGRPFPTKHLIRVFLQLASAVEAAHAQGIIHRDIKPGNVLIDKEGNAKILDFGLAKRVLNRPDSGSTLELSERSMQDLTITGMTMGTLEYMSPEQIRGEELDIRTDLFNLGLVFYELATGRRAFPGPTPGIILEGILARPPISPASLNPDLSLALDAIILKLLEKDRDLRYQTAQDLHADLKRMRRDKESGDTTLSLDQAGIPRRKEPRGVGHSGGLGRFFTPTRSAALVVAILILAMLAGIYIRARRGPALTERDTIVLTDFTNSTGDAVFDGTLKQALAVELWQSPYLNIFPERRVRDALRLMGRSPDDRVTREVAREICLREGGRAFIAGSISSLGQNYVVTLEAVDAQTGETLSSAQSESTTKEEVLHSLAKSASRLRTTLGESLSSIEKFDAPLDRATTPSLEALRAFSLGNAEREKGREFDSLPFFKRALELDPNFALAEARLAAVYTNIGEASQAVEHARKAFELRDRVSERERYYIAAHYHGTVTGDVDRSVENYEMWKHAYPRDATPGTNLSAIYNDMGSFDRALAEAQAASHLVNINKEITSINIAAAHMGAGRFPEARAVLGKMLAENPDSSSAPVVSFMTACAERDEAWMQRLLEQTDGKETEASLHLLQAQALASAGELAKSREIFGHTVDLSRRFKRREFEASAHARQALVESLLGDASHARSSAVEGLRLSSGKETQAIAAQALARAHEFDRAERIASELEKQYPEDSILNRVWLPTVRAAIEIEQGRPVLAVEQLRSVKPYELGFLAGVAPTFLRGQAFLRMGDGARAAAEFERIVARTGVEAVSPLHSLAWLELARAAKLAGNRARSQQAFQEFLTRWKNADPNLTILKQAKSEFARP